MNTTEKGNLSELKIAVRLLELGNMVLKSIGEGCRYDLLIDKKDGSFSRIQCKTGRIRKGCLVFQAATVYSWRKGKRIYTEDEIDFFGVYCPDNGKCYLIPRNRAKSDFTTFRLEPTKNNQSKGIVWAKEFEF